MTKSELRCYFRNRRKTFVSQLRNSKLDHLVTAMKSRLEDGIAIGGNIAGYEAMTSEVDPRAMLDNWRDQGCTIALPYFECRGAPMEFRICNGDTETSAYGFRQPLSDDPIAEKLDIMLIPLVAADSSGNRIGQGKGHYDRFLSQSGQAKPGVTVGLAWECQIAKDIPADKWDEPLDYICTPERLIGARA